MTPKEKPAGVAAGGESLNTELTTLPDSISHLDPALGYASRGWSVVPLPPELKNPIKGFKWRDESTSDPVQIVEWWQRHPTMNIGIDCGKSRLAVIDIDRFEARGYRLPETMTVITPRGGLHYYYPAPRWSITIAQNVIPGVGMVRGIDIRGDGGYVVAPPSFNKLILEPDGSVKQAEGTYLAGINLPLIPQPWPSWCRDAPPMPPGKPKRYDWSIDRGSNVEARIEGVHKAVGFVPLSLEVLQDGASVAQQLGNLLAEGKDTLESAAFTTGSGSGQPIGILTAVRYRANGSWLASRTIWNTVAQFETTNGSLAHPQLQDRDPVLLNRPSYESSDMSSTITTGEQVLLFGDFNNYVIADRVGLTVEFIPHLFATGNNRPSGQRGLFAYTGSEPTALTTTPSRS